MWRHLLLSCWLLRIPLVSPAPTTCAGLHVACMSVVKLVVSALCVKNKGRRKLALWQAPHAVPPCGVSFLLQSLCFCTSLEAVSLGQVRLELQEFLC